MTELIQQIYNLKTHKEILVKNLDELKLQISDIDQQIESKEAQLLVKLSESNVTEVEHNGLVGFKQSKATIGYTSENDVLNILKRQFNNNYIKTKVTESLDKNALKKALKLDTTLAETLSPYIVDRTTDYVIVTTTANRERMLDHINAGKTK